MFDRIRHDGETDRFADKYEAQADEEDEMPAEPATAGESEEDDWEEMQNHPAMSPRQRPKALNRAMRAMVRTMAAEGNNMAVAYAMDKTKRHFTERQLKADDSKPAKQWQKAVHEYRKMGWREQWEWRERVLRTHPRLDKLVKRV